MPAVLALQRLAGNAAVAALLDRHTTMQRLGCGPGRACGSCSGENDSVGEETAILHE